MGSWDHPNTQTRGTKQVIHFEFVDVEKPTDDELREWNTLDAYVPHQEWHLFLTQQERVPVLLECIADERCRRPRVLLEALYCLVGHGDLDDPRIRRHVEATLDSPVPSLRLWAQRATRVIADPSTIDGDEWCYREDFSVPATAD